MITPHPSTCAAQSGRTYATTCRTPVMGLETLIIQGLVWITSQQQVKWAGVFVRLSLPVLAPIVVFVICIVIDVLGVCIGTVTIYLVYRYRYRCRGFFISRPYHTETFLPSISNTTSRIDESARALVVLDVEG